MANITYRRTGEFLRKVFDLILDKPDGLPSREILEHIENTVTRFLRPGNPGCHGAQRLVEH